MSKSVLEISIGIDKGRYLYTLILYYSTIEIGKTVYTVW